MVVRGGKALKGGANNDSPKSTIDDIPAAFFYFYIECSYGSTVAEWFC